MEKSRWVQFAPDEAEQFGKWLLAYRESKGWRRPQLAERMGYKNLSKGCSRIADWESGRDMPRGDRPEVLKEALGDPGPKYEELLNAFNVERRRQIALGYAEESRVYGVEWSEMRMLAEHHQVLLDNAEVILERPEFYRIHLVRNRVRVAYIGGASLCLGALLEGWLDGSLISKLGGEPLHVLSVGMSPLSGSVSGFGFLSDGKLKNTGNPALKSVTGELLQKMRGLDGGVTGWNLGQLLATLGVTLPEVSIGRKGEEPLWRYDFSSFTMRSPDGEVDVSLLFGDREPDASWAQRWERGPGLTIGQLSPLKQGIFVGSKLKWVDSKDREWVATPGRLVGSNGAGEFHLDGLLPPAVLVWVSERL